MQYGDKLNLAIGKSGLILDVVVEDGNPADAERFLPMLDRQIARRGRPRPMAAMPAAIISNRPRPHDGEMSPSARRKREGANGCAPIQSSASGPGVGVGRPMSSAIAVRDPHA